jgi:hypothetical protein
MDEVTPPPPAINWESENLDEGVEVWGTRKTYISWPPVNWKKIQCAYLLIWIGEKGREIYKTFEIEAENKNKIEPYLLKFHEYATPKKNRVFTRYIFQKHDQHEG